jgi:peptide/nickel transport system substrate-binding protein
MRRKRSFFAGGFLLPLGFIASLSAACCGRATYVDRRALEVQVPTEIVEIDPRYATRGLDVKTSRLIHAGLVALDPDTLLPHPTLARSLRLAGERTIAIELDPTVQFHSGHQLDANDVCSTITALRDPQLQSPHRAVVAAFAACRILDARHLELELAYPRATWMTDLEMPILRSDQTRLARGHATELDGLGPFAIASKSASELRLKHVTRAVDPVVQTVSIRTVRDENARVLRLLAGQADIAVNATSPALLPQLARSGTLAVSARPGANVTYLLVNNDRPPFAASNSRRALSLAIDRRAIIEYLLNGHAQVARWMFPAAHWSSPSDLSLPVYDRNLAALQLRGKGPVTLLTSPDRSRLTLARVIAQMLGDAGLVTQVIPLDLGVMLSRLDAGDFTLAILQIPELTEPNVLSWFFHPRAIPGEGSDGRNRARYRSARAASLLDEAASSFDHATRKRLYGQLAHLMMSDMPVVPLWHEDQIVVSAKRVAGFVPTAAGRWDSLASTELR